MGSDQRSPDAPSASPRCGTTERRLGLPNRLQGRRTARLASITVGSRSWSRRNPSVILPVLEPVFRRAMQLEGSCCRGHSQRKQPRHGEQRQLQADHTRNGFRGTDQPCPWCRPRPRPACGLPRRATAFRHTQERRRSTPRHPHCWQRKQPSCPILPTPREGASEATAAGRSGAKSQHCHRSPVSRKSGATPSSDRVHAPLHSAHARGH